MHHHPTHTRYFWTGSHIHGPRGRVNPSCHHTGYLVFSTYTDGKKSQQRAHRFLIECVLGRPLNQEEQVNHIDGDKLNNQVDNLEIVTAKENIQHAHRIGLCPKRFGEHNSAAKLSNQQALCLMKDLEDGATNQQLGIKYKLHPNYVSLIRHKRRWKNLWQIYLTKKEWDDGNDTCICNT